MAIFQNHNFFTASGGVGGFKGIFYVKLFYPLCFRVLRLMVVYGRKNETPEMA